MPSAADLFQLLITGLSVGVIYALIALGFVVVWKSSGVANLALGQLVLVSSWYTYGLLEQAGLPLYIGLPLVVIVSLFLGWIIERIVLRPLIAQPILSLITVTLGLAYFLEGLVVIIWPVSQAKMPELFPGKDLHIGSAVLEREYLWAAIISLALFGILALYFRYSRMGIAMRATADDQKAVQACGIPVTKIFSRSWMFACVLAAVGGILVSSTGNIATGLTHTGLKAFSVVILGGLESFPGAILAGPIVGVVETIGSGILTPIIKWSQMREVIPFVIIIIVMFIKPFGLFGEERIERI